MKGIVARLKVKAVDVVTMHFIHSDDPAGILVVSLAPRSMEDRELVLALLQEAEKNDSWVELGGGAGSLVDSRTATPAPLESDQPALGAGPVVAEY